MRKENPKSHPFQNAYKFDAYNPAKTRPKKPIAPANAPIFTVVAAPVNVGGAGPVGYPAGGAGGAAGPVGTTGTGTTVWMVMGLPPSVVTTYVVVA